MTLIFCTIFNSLFEYNLNKNFPSYFASLFHAISRHIITFYRMRKKIRTKNMVLKSLPLIET